ncbi:MAG: nitrite reductase small subunit NirD [Deltaproteobacteria bacterium]
MSSFLPALPFAELVEGKGRCVTVGGRDVALFRVEGRLFAIDNGCPHRGGPLSEGDVSGCLVYCPLHAWSFDLATGVSPGNPRARVETYPVRVTDGQVEVLLPERELALEPSVAPPRPDE